MLHFLPGPLLGLLSGSLIILNTFFWFLIFVPIILLKLLIFFPQPRLFFSKILIFCAELWVAGNSWILAFTQKITWDIQGTEALDPQKSYLVISNHLSWVDIFVLQHVLRGKVPFLKFFVKDILIWVPMLGIAWWALDMPFMKRYSREFLDKHPELKGKDMETTRKSCQKFKAYPVAVINFLEGTRFKAEKHQKQNSPYQNLLRPKAGGIGLALSVMSDVLTEVVDVTIAYPDNQTQKLFWALLSGKLPRIVVRVQTRSLPPDTLGRDYLEDENYRETIQTWVNQIWQEKDHILNQIPRKTPLSHG